MRQRDLWLKHFYDEEIPAWNCPTCEVGVLELDEWVNREPKFSRPAMVSVFDASSERAWNEEGYPYPDGVFSAILRCHRSECREKVAVCGNFGTEERYISRDDYGRSAARWPFMFVPSLRFFHIPDKCPDNIKSEVVAAFAVYWSDTNSCLNRIRTAVEVILSYMKIPIADAKMKRIDLHRRIEILEKTEPRVAGHMMALKWLGNAGSHAGVVKSEDALDGFELLEYILRDRFDTLKAISDAIRKKKGPRRHPKKKR